MREIIWRCPGWSGASCMPERGRKVEAGVHKETKSLSAEGRWAKRSDSREKNARR